MKTAAENRGGVEVLRLSQKVGWILWLSNIGPLLGLFGTVTGMIAAFNVIKALGAGGEPGTIQERAQKILDILYQDPDALFLVVQDIYMTETARDAHLILPAAGWGEANETSINCNSRLLRV